MNHRRSELHALAHQSMVMITNTETALVKALAGQHRPADIDQIVAEVATSLHQVWAAVALDEPDLEPDDEDLEAIEAEWPILAAELAVVEAQCRFFSSPDVFARRALRRAEAARNRVAAHHTNSPRTHGAHHP